MTTEEAIEFIAQSVKSDVDMAKVADAIKALKQEPVLDKIKAEIQENINYNKKMNYLGIVAGLLLALDIIDKYKGEGEDNE
jgi:hypothetical protein